jgi:hypothetical protein
VCAAGQLLKPAETVTKLWSGQKYATMALVLPCSNALLNTWERQSESLSAKYNDTLDPKKQESIKLTRDIASLLIAGLKRRFGPQDFAADDNQPFLIASFLHPVYKNLMFVPEPQRPKVIGQVKGWIRVQLGEKFPPKPDDKQPKDNDKDQVHYTIPTPAQLSLLLFRNLPIRHRRQPYQSLTSLRSLVDYGRNKKNPIAMQLTNTIVCRPKRMAQTRFNGGVKYQQNCTSYGF